MNVLSVFFSFFSIFLAPWKLFYGVLWGPRCFLAFCRFQLDAKVGLQIVSGGLGSHPVEKSRMCNVVKKTMS